jgi:hypothetical protein
MAARPGDPSFSKGMDARVKPAHTISYRVRSAPNDGTFKGDGRIWYANAPSRQVSQDNEPRMLKLITILAASIPVILFLKNLFFQKSKVMQKASAEFRKQIDYLVWGILFLVGCGIVYSFGRLIYSIWS